MARFLIPKSVGMYRLCFDALDGDTMAIRYADPIPTAFVSDHYVHDPRSGYGGGAPVMPDHLPTRMLAYGRGQRPRDFNSAYHMYCVNRRVIDIIERFQKEIQYFPVELFRKDETAWGTYYFLFTTILLDAVVREKTTARWTPTRPGKGLWQPQLYLGETFTFDKALLGDAHMWVDPNAYTEAALVTDALFTALQKAKIDFLHDSPAFAEV